MALNTVTTGNTVLASDVNQLVNVLQRASGQTEAGRYHFVTSAYANTAAVGGYADSLTRVSTPVSVSIDTSDGLSNIGSVGTANLTASGFTYQGSGSGPNLNVSGGGSYTIQF